MRATLRTLLQRPGTTLPAVLVVALAVGVSTALFAYLAALLWPTVAAPAPERVVELYLGTKQDPRASSSFDELQLVRRTAGLEAVVAVAPQGVSLAIGGESRFAWCNVVSGGYFDFFGARPLRGRLLQPGDDRPGAPLAVVLHPGYWRAQLGADPEIVGRTVSLNGAAATVVGIAPEEFQGHGHPAALYAPLAFADALSGSRRLHDPQARFLRLTGRLRPGWTAEQLRQSLLPAARAADAAAPLDDVPRQVAVVPSLAYDPGWGSDPYMEPARALFACALLFVLLAAASVANLQLARASLRRGEWSVRIALGASRGRLALRALADTALLCGAGGLLGLPIALALAAQLDRWLRTDPGGLAGWSDLSRFVRLDGRGLLFAAVTAAGCAAIVACAEALAAPRGAAQTALVTRGSARVVAGSGGRRALVAVQLALSLALCLGGGLLARSLRQATLFDPGYRVDGLYAATLYAPRNLDGGTPVRLYERVRAALAAAPGIERPSLAHLAPMAGFWSGAEAGAAERPAALRHAAFDLISPGYFATLGVPLRAGRPLDERDGADAEPAVVIGEGLARELWGGPQAALGRLLVSPGSPHDTWRVVGVAPDLPGGTPDSRAPSTIYFPVAQRSHSRMSLLVRSPLPPAEVARRVREALRQVHPGLALMDVTTGRQALRTLVTPQRMRAEVASLFALLGLAVSTVGLFGLLSHAVVSGQRELAVRLAVGARPGDLRRLVLRSALRLLVVGGALGVALWIPLERLLRGMLLGVRPLDPATLVGATMLLVLATLGAALLPALRAARVTPAEALRQD